MALRLGDWRVERNAFAAIACACLLAPACGGNSEGTKSTNAVGGSSADAGDGDASASGGSSAGGSASGSGGSTTGGSGGSGAGGSGGSSAGGSSGSASGGSAGTTPTADGRVFCGWLSGRVTECKSGEYCCDNSCTSMDLACGRVAFHCDDAADCPNAFCCVTKISKRDGGAQVAQCRASCDADTEIILCRHSDAQGDCPQGMRCQITATLPPPHGYCCAPGSMCPST